jgi:hypothetical protein
MFAVCVALPAWGQGLVCPKGQTAICTTKSTVCLDALQCNSEGFACRSDARACTRDRADLQARLDRLSRDYQALKQGGDQALRENELLRQQLREAESRYQALEDCILFATSVEDVQFCP